MKHTLEFTPLDLRTWNRGEIFYYFSKMAPTGYSLTVQIDITKMKAVVDEKGLKFFPAYLWLVTRTLNQFTEFRIAEQEGIVGQYNFLTPLYANFHQDDKTFSLMWTEYDDDFMSFYRDYIRNQQIYGSNHGILAQKTTVPPLNAYTVSCVPWIPFQHFAVHSYDQKPYYFPSIEAGAFTRAGSKLLMPLSITCHHAATDGYHVSKFLEYLQRDVDRFSDFVE